MEPTSDLSPPSSAASPAEDLESKTRVATRPNDLQETGDIKRDLALYMFAFNAARRYIESNVPQRFEEYKTYRDTIIKRGLPVSKDGQGPVVSHSEPEAESAPAAPPWIREDTEKQFQVWWHTFWNEPHFRGVSSRAAYQIWAAARGLPIPAQK